MPDALGVDAELTFDAGFPSPPVLRRIPSPTEGGGRCGSTPNGAGDCAAAWDTALHVAALIAADPHGLGGVVVRAGAGPVRERWLDHLRVALGHRPLRRLPPGTGDERLIGGLDLPATLAAGRAVPMRGLLAEADGGVLVVPMAERLEPGTAARLAAALDTGTLALERDGLAARHPARIGLVLLDEGGPDEAVPEALADRLAFRVDLDGVSLADLGAGVVGAGTGRVVGPREAAPISDDPPSADPVVALCSTAAALGIASPRAPLLALRVARRIAGPAPDEAAVIEAARLVLAHRATCLPAPEAHESPEDASPEDTPPEDASENRQEERPDEAERTDPADDPRHADAPVPDDVVLEAVRAAIPPDLLARLAAGPAAAGPRAGRFGAQRADPRNGRPAGARPGDPRRGRLDLVATLRAAAPWQALRPGPQPIRIRAEDLRIRRLVRAPETTTIVCVDASGSAARERLAEAKGAVELMLAEAYARRDRVALVSFRGTGASLLLPPTRALARARRDLAGLPGGGGTPLAAGLDAAGALAAQVRRGGGRPVVVVLTDGRANVARSGAGGRVRAGAEAEEAARALRAARLPVLVLDTGARGEGARGLAEAAGALYQALPRAGPRSLQAAVRVLHP